MPARGAAALDESLQHALYPLQIGKPGAHVCQLALGLLDPGLLIAIGEGSTNWRGLVRATNIAADWNESLTVRQTIEVERHYL